MFFTCHDSCGEPTWPLSRLMIVDTTHFCRGEHGALAAAAVAAATAAAAAATS